MTLSLQEWARKVGISPETIRSRLDHQGYDVARALTTPVANKFAKRGSPPVPPPRPCPKMLKHTKSGQACARWKTGKKDNIRYFGPWGSKEAAGAYRAFQAEWVGAGSHLVNPSGGCMVGDLVAEYMGHVGRYYVKDGKPTSEQHSQRAAMRVLAALYKLLPVTEFKPRQLKACQQAMIEKGWARDTINRNVWRIRRCFSWGVAEELVPASIADALDHVPHLQAGRTTAPDPDPVMSVPASRVVAVLPHLDPNPERAAVLAAMIQFHELSGCRPGELCAMTADAIDTSETEWAYRVRDKNTHRQRKRKPLTRWFGPQSQEVLRPFLSNPGPGGRIWCFPPRYPNSEKSRRVPVSSARYSELIREACRAAGIEPWTPHQLRHNRATNVQRIYESDEAAAAAIGDTVEVTRAVYADPSEAVARRIARATG
ncbi:tyrosine-type recombinase/integrase [Gemmata massiliana]|uniref:tyrosine-type recombinase/integrase n=1 Tax=Gemmata massiliana TaxID=1210884 RepID=UPI0013A6F163|nr:site-specific integrase [Gemmata massiliana]